MANESSWEKSEAEHITGKIMLEPAVELGLPEIDEAYFVQQVQDDGSPKFVFNVSAKFYDDIDSYVFTAFADGRTVVSRLVDLGRETADTDLKNKGTTLAQKLVTTLPETPELVDLGITISKERLQEIWNQASSLIGGDY